MSSMHSYVSEPPTVALAGRTHSEWAAAWATRLGLDTAYLLLGLPAGVIAFTVVITGWATARGLPRLPRRHRGVGAGARPRHHAVRLPDRARHDRRLARPGQRRALARSAR